VFISGDDQWQECIKTFTVSLFLSEMLRGSETVKGMNLAGFDEQALFQILSTISATDEALYRQLSKVIE